MINPFRPSPMPKGYATPIGMAGYDNPRENIDPHVKTKVIDTKEIVQNGVLYNLAALSGSGINELSGAFWTLSGANNIQHQTFLQLSGANANQTLNITPYGIIAGTISGSFLSSSGANIYGTNAGGGIFLNLKNAEGTGTTTVPYIELHGYLSSIRNGSAIRFGRDDVYASAATAKSNIIFYTTNQDVNIERMRINSSGDVSIGTGTNAASNLEISGSTGIILNRSSSTYGASFTYKKNNSTTWTIKEDANGVNNNALVYSNSSEDGTGIGQIMTFTQTGKIGIGTGNALPSEKLQVSGGNIICNGNISGATIKAVNGFTGTGAYTNFTISGGIIISAS